MYVVHTLFFCLMSITFNDLVPARDGHLSHSYAGFYFVLTVTSVTSSVPNIFSWMASLRAPDLCIMGVEDQSI
jgi:hypothetical protein